MEDDDHNRPLISKGKPLALQIRPPWGEVLAIGYKDKEMIVEDAHVANQKNMGFVVV